MRSVFFQGMTYAMHSGCVILEVKSKDVILQLQT